MQLRCQLRKHIKKGVIARKCRYRTRCALVRMLGQNPICRIAAKLLALCPSAKAVAFGTCLALSSVLDENSR